MSIVSRTAVVGGLSLTLAMGAAAPVLATPASADVHVTAAQTAAAKPKQLQKSFWERVNRLPDTQTVPREGKPLLRKSKVGKNITLKVISTQIPNADRYPMQVQLFTRKNGKKVPLGTVVRISNKDRGKSFKLNKKTVKPGTAFYVLLKSGSKTTGAILKGTIHY